jgi:phenylacetate-CoA ligase
MVSKTKRFVPLMGVLQLIAKSSPNMKEYQLYQDCEGEIVLRIVKNEGFSEDDERCIRENFQKRLGDEFSLFFTYVDSIRRTNRGKYQFLIQKLTIQFSP